jgi:hypothetical protein
MDLIGLMVQLFAGAVAGNVVGKSQPELDLGMAGNAIVGAVAAVCSVHLLQILIPPLGGMGELDLGALAAQSVAATVTAAMITAVVGLARSELREPKQALD